MPAPVELLSAASISQACLPTPESFRRCAFYAFEFAARDDVEAAAEFCEELEDGERRVRLYGVTDGVVDAGELACEKRDAMTEIVGGVDVERGSELFCELTQRNVAAAEL
jgi:hypothetical protein